MKKFKFLLVALLLPISILAQIKLAEEKPPQEEKPYWWNEREAIDAPYDSLYYKIEVYPIWDAYKKYIGQRLYLPSNERLSDSYNLNYTDSPRILFSNKIDTTEIIRGYYEPNDTLPIYLYKYRDAKNNINIVGNKYYEIIDVLSIKKSVEFEKHSIYAYSKNHLDNTMYQTPSNSGNEDFKMFSPGVEEGGAPYFVLREVESGDTVYTGFPREFILVGGFVKLQQEFIGLNIFEVKDKPSENFILHEQSYENLIKNKLKCIDVVLNKKGSVDLVLKNIDDATEATEIALSDLIKSIDVYWSWKWVTEKIYNEAWDILLAENAVKEKEKREVELQREKENQQYRQQRAQQEAKRKQELTTKYGAIIADKIIAGKFEIGMSKSVCAEIAGYATIADKTATTETWKISDIFFGGVTYLFFVNDKLVRIVNP